MKFFGSIGNWWFKQKITIVCPFKIIMIVFGYILDGQLSNFVISNVE